jgi:hypothetical protein
LDHVLRQVEDPWTSDILKFTEMGFSREEVCMALAAFGADASKDDQARDLSVSVTPQRYEQPWCALQG